MNTRSVLKQVGSAGIKLSLNGDKLVLECAAKPPDSLLDAIKADKDNIMAILKRHGPELKPPSAPKPDEAELEERNTKGGMSMMHMTAENHP